MENNSNKETLKKIFREINLNQVIENFFDPVFIPINFENNGVIKTIQEPNNMPKITYVAQTFPAMIGNWISIAEYNHPRTLKQAQEDIILAEKQDKSPTKSAKRIIKRFIADDGKITETVFSGLGANGSSSNK